MARPEVVDGGDIADWVGECGLFASGSGQGPV
jgi:hypothetical protein